MDTTQMTPVLNPSDARRRTRNPPQLDDDHDGYEVSEEDAVNGKDYRERTPKVVTWDGVETTGLEDWKG